MIEHKNREGSRNAMQNRFAVAYDYALHHEEQGVIWRILPE